MAKRFTGTDIWQQDWFLDMPNEYKLFWNYILAECDHIGFFKVNIRTFCSLIDHKIDLEKALVFFNTEKIRIRVVKVNLWFIEDFISFQYGHSLNAKNRVHDSILRGLEINGIALKTIRGLNDLELRSKRPLINPNHGVKDKDKDKDKDKEKGGMGEKTKSNKIKGVALSDLYPFYSPSFENVWKDFLEMRIKKRKPLTDRAVILNLNSIQKLSKGDERLATAICEQTIMRGWDGFFDLKETTETAKSTENKGFILGQKHNANI